MEKIIIKYLQNEISSTELEELINWLKEPKNQEEFKAYVKKQSLLNQVSTEVNEDLAFQKLMKRIVQDDQSKVKPIKSFAWLKYAAIFIAVIGLGYGIFQQDLWNQRTVKEVPQITLQLKDGDIKVVNENEEGVITRLKGNVVLKQEKDKLVYSKTGDAKKTPLVFNTLEVPLGKRFELVLVDGTKIVLNAGSQLRYPTFFPKEGKRNVYLKGEAFFTVAEDVTRPFIVHTDELKIRVLGTEFNVSAYKDDKKTTAVLASGKIAATPTHKKYSEENTAIIAPGEMISIEKGELQVSKVNVSKHIAWVSGKLMFINDSFETIAHKLERYYDLEIINHCSLLKESTFTGTFESDKIEDVLKTFQIHTPFDYKKENNKVIISACGG